MEYVFTLLGFIILIGSGNYLVKGGVSIARHYGLSTLLIGVTIVAFGTSAPELLVSLQAATAGYPEMALGNVIGSNISNIALVLALTALIMPVSVNRNSAVFDWPVMMFSAVVLALFSLNGKLERYEGLLLNLFLILFVWLSVRRAGGKKRTENEDIQVPAYSLALSVFIILLSSGGLAFGAYLLVQNATKIATMLGVSERAIAISMLAVGTSLPELVTSIIAAIQKETDISVGNIMGSNIFNILSVLGLSAVVKPLDVDPLSRIDIYIMILVSFVLILTVVPFRKAKIVRVEGLILLILYFGYLIYVFR